LKKAFAAVILVLSGDLYTAVRCYVLFSMKLCPSWRLGTALFLCHRHMAGNTMEGRIFQHGVLYDFLVKSQAHKHNILCRVLFRMHKILWFRQECASGGICQLLITSVCPKTWSSRKLYLTRCWTLSI
jgi:hypothetical protein